MKENKFKAWDKKNKCWVKDLESLLISLDGKVWEEDGDETGTWLSETDDYIIVNYTGLKDKNGKEIYEGDICKAKSRSIDKDGKIREFVMGEIIFINAHYIFQIKIIFQDCYLSYWAKDCEVVGNIYENLKLLEEEQCKKT